MAVKEKVTESVISGYDIVCLFDGCFGKLIKLTSYRQTIDMKLRKHLL